MAAEKMVPVYEKERGQGDLGVSFPSPRPSSLRTRGERGTDCRGLLGRSSFAVAVGGGFSLILRGRSDILMDDLLTSCWCCFLTSSTRMAQTF